MDLKNGNIKMSEIIRVPKAKQILMREIPQYMSPMMMSMAGGMSLNQVLSFAKGRISEEKISSIIKQIEAV